MGITNLSIERLKRFDCIRPLLMCELGAQNIYTDGEWYGKIAKDFFTLNGVQHESYDIIVHQNCEYMDLRIAIPKTLKNKYDVVTDFGTTEHIDGNYYQGNKNIHDLCKVGGLIIRENPKTGHWIGHGNNYVDMEFYNVLAKMCDYEILELTEEFAMGNTTDGGNVSVVLRKISAKPFPTIKAFVKAQYFPS